MCIPSLSLTMHFKFMIILLLGMITSRVDALSTDKQQDLEIHANAAEMDDIKAITIYRGDVVVTQGSLRITGHTLEVHFNTEGDMELAIMFGNPATYRQLPDNSEQYDEAESKKMEYYALKDYVILIDEAQVIKPDGSKMSGARIEYDTVTNHVIAKSKPPVSGDNTVNKQNDGRVKITIKKKKETP